MDSAEMILDALDTALLGEDIHDAIAIAEEVIEGAQARVAAMREQVGE